MIVHWSILIVVPVVFVASVAFAYRLGKVTGLAGVVRDFDEIVVRIQQLCWSKNYAGLEVFLHDLTSDSPLSLRRLEKNSRHDKSVAGLNQQQGGDTG